MFPLSSTANSISSPSLTCSARLISSGSVSCAFGRSLARALVLGRTSPLACDLFKSAPRLCASGSPVPSPRTFWLPHIRFGQRKGLVKCLKKIFEQTRTVINSRRETGGLLACGSHSLTKQPVGHGAHRLSTRDAEHRVPDGQAGRPCKSPKSNAATAPSRCGWPRTVTAAHPCPPTAGWPSSEFTADQLHI